jgi:hypothetical protein
LHNFSSPSPQKSIPCAKDRLFFGPKARFFIPEDTSPPKKGDLPVLLFFSSSRAKASPLPESKLLSRTSFFLV